MAQRLSIQKTREWCATESGAQDSPEAAAAAPHSPSRRLASRRTAAPRTRSEKLIITRSVCACDSSMRIGSRAPRLHILNPDLCSPTSGAFSFLTCHGDMTHP